MSYVNRKKLFDILSNAKQGIEPLESELELEDLLSAIKENTDQISFYENLKKKRATEIDEEIKKTKEQIKTLESIILATLDNVDKKSLKFPGVGKVTIVKRSGKWVIDDSDKFLEVLKEEDTAAYGRVVTMKPSIAKKEVDVILNAWEKVKKVPNCVSKTQPFETVKISFDKDIKVTYDDDEAEDTSPENLDF
jgi:hypothetical protein